MAGGFGAHHIGLILIFCSFGLMLIVSVGTPIWTKVEFAKSNTSSSAIRRGV